MNCQNCVDVYVGIDPGKSGSIAILNKDANIIDIKDWSDEYIIDNYIKYIEYMYNIKNCILEKVHAYPKQGVNSVWSFGENYGIWKGLLAANKIPYKLVTPQTWQKGQLLPSDSKDKKKRSLVVCRRLYPNDIKKYFKREKDHGRSDAVLIAKYGINFK